MRLERPDRRSPWVPGMRSSSCSAAVQGSGRRSPGRWRQGGSRVVIVGRDHGRLAAAAGRVGGDVRTAAADAGDRDAVDAFFAGLGRDVDHLVLSFSTGRAGGPFRDPPMADLAAAVRGKLAAYLSVVQAALPRLRADGSVTLVGAARRMTSPRPSRC
jgi:NADP-dependent 3-hydroxy acid dehydrogenase YdfG